MVNILGKTDPSIEHNQVREIKSQVTPQKGNGLYICLITSLVSFINEY